MRWKSLMCQWFSSQENSKGSILGKGKCQQFSCLKNLICHFYGKNTSNQDISLFLKQRNSPYFLFKKK